MERRRDKNWTVRAVHIKKKTSEQLSTIGKSERVLYLSPLITKKANEYESKKTDDVKIARLFFWGSHLRLGQWKDDPVEG